MSSNDPKVIGEKLNKIAEATDTRGEYFKIGELYGFRIIVKTEEAIKNDFKVDKNGIMQFDKAVSFKDNRFFIEGEGNIKYNYNNGHIATDPILASTNFLKALEKIPSLIEKYQAESEKLQKDVPILQNIISSEFRKEPELRELKLQLDSLSRNINLSLKNKDETDTETSQTVNPIKPTDPPPNKGMKM